MFELALHYPTGGLRNPWEDVVVEAAFIAPSGAKSSIRGFYYDRDTYKVRFAPVEPGLYTYVASIRGPIPFNSRSGSFVAPASARKGFVRVSAANPTHLVFDDGAAFHALGINDCWGKDSGVPNRLSQSNHIDAGQSVGANTYFATYASAGFNLLRWDVGNCSFGLAANIASSGNTYLVDEGMVGDELIATASRNGFRIMFGPFMKPPFPDAAGHLDQQVAIERYLDYVIARYGAYADIWDLTNETDPGNLPDSWLRFVVDYMRSHDPYHHLLTNSYPRDGDWTYLDLRSPHAYASTTPGNADEVTVRDAKPYKTGDRPVVYGEFGNHTCNWDATSALRMRLRIWSAFFDDFYIVFWNSTFKKDYCPQDSANEYLGPDERGYVRVLQDFTELADPAVKVVPLQSSLDSVRLYGLRSPRVYLAYLHHYSDHTHGVMTQFAVDVPFSGNARWIDPATGKVVANTKVRKGSQVLTTPVFAVDLALQITPED